MLNIYLTITLIIWVMLSIVMVTLEFLEAVETDSSLSITDYIFPIGFAFIVSALWPIGVVLTISRKFRKE